MQEHKSDLFVCGGCNAKIGAGILGTVLKSLPKTACEGLLVGFDSSDDAAVIQMTSDLAIVQTLDFFPPMVTDPALFGAIAAANALSDVYAMGGEPVCALNIVCYPEEASHEHAYAALQKILTGGAEKVKEAGAALVGGHSIHDPKVKYGLSVMGKVHPERMWKNNTPQDGDILFLTKKLGVGIITTAYSAGEMAQAAFDEACASMTTLNKYAAELMHTVSIHACTDVTGFGLIGHLLEMAGTEHTAFIRADRLPFIEAAYQAAHEFLLTAGGQRNRNYAQGKIDFSTLHDFGMEEILFDPQTSGGLLFAVAPSDAETIRGAFKAKGIALFEIGTIAPFHGVPIIVS